MARKSKAGFRSPWLLNQGPFEGIAWLAKRRRAADQKKLSDPTEADIAEMRRAIGDDQTFEKLSESNKTLLFCAMLTIRAQLKIYGEDAMFEEKSVYPVLSALIALKLAIPNASVPFRTVSDEMSEERGITVPEAEQKMVEFFDMADYVLKKFQGIVATPDIRKMRSLHMQHEAGMIADCLERLDVEVPLSGEDSYGRKGSPGVRLAVRIVRYTSGRRTETGAFRKMVARARELRKIPG
jgi:hypothetical protein